MVGRPWYRDGEEVTETLLTQINQAGWRVYLLHQTSNYSWQGSLCEVETSRLTNTFTGSTPEAVLADAFEDTTNFKVRKNYGVDILADLGLSKPINRRF